MTEKEQALIAALEHSERIATQTLATLAELALRQLEHQAVAVALSTGETVAVAPTHVVVVADQLIFDTLIAQLREVRAVCAELTAQLTAKPIETVPTQEEAERWDTKPDTAPDSAPTAETRAQRRQAVIPPNGRRKKRDPTT